MPEIFVWNAIKMTSLVSRIVFPFEASKGQNFTGMPSLAVASKVPTPASNLSFMVTVTQVMLCELVF
jgi:hypothetical protein